MPSGYTEICQTCGCPKMKHLVNLCGMCNTKHEFLKEGYTIYDFKD